jgi:hypothetical protein
MRGLVPTETTLSGVMYGVHQSEPNLILVKARLVKFNYCDGKTPPQNEAQKVH